MNILHLRLRWLPIAIVTGLFTILPSGCVVVGGGYGYVDGAGIGLDYYEPYGVIYGGWGSRYRVGPFRDGHHRPDRRGGQPRPHAYRPAPLSRPMPSIPGSGASTGKHRN